MIATLRIQSVNAGNLPFSATVLPLQGQMPDGMVLVSPDDGGLRSTVLARWSDNSAALVVVSSFASVTAGADRSIRLQLGTPTAGEADLTAAAITQAVSSVAINAGPAGSVTLSDFANPERTWWASPQTICARYRATFTGQTTLEAVIDIQAWTGGRALVEVVVENGKMTTASPSKPAAVNYAAATVSVNGSAIATVNGNGAPEGSHAAFRAWYARAWVGGSDAGLRVTQAHAELQLHPLLFKCDQAANFDAGVYASDAYVPWGAARHRFTNMGAGGDHPSIGPLPQWESRALQGGDYRAWRAVEASALAVLGFNVNYRDSGTGLVPSFAQLAGKSQQTNWPSHSGPNSDLTWETAHHPAAGLLAFIGRPSPVFTEIAQKVAVWNGTWSTYTDGGAPQPTGVFIAAYQTRARAWGIRSLAHAIFLTPSNQAWRAAGITSLAQNFAYLDSYRTDPKAKLNITWENRPGNPFNVYGSVPRVNLAGWQYHYFVVEIHKAASAKFLSGTDQSLADTFADWCALQPVRWINEQTNGSWRYVPYVTIIGRSGDSPTTLNSFDTWSAQRADWMTDTPSSVAGGWFSTGGETNTTYASFTAIPTAGAGYAEYFWSALVAAVERKVPGASQAWSTVQSNITGLAAWRGGFAAEPRWGSTPRGL